MARLRSLFPCVLLFTLLLAPGCATNPGGDGDGGLDGTTGGRDGSRPGTLACGASAEACCVGRICELGLDCGRGDVCCVQAGSSASCSSASDCCRGLACDSSRCCAPRTSACTGSSDCCDGLVCSAAGVCQNPGEVDPGDPGCGTPGGTCCAGFSCRDESVCVAGTGMCSGCGGADQPCCDGSSACTSMSLGCDVMTATCVTIVPEDACGLIDNPCCPGLGGSLIDCVGDFVCVAGTCLDDEDTGFEGAPCGTRGGCDSDLVCDRRTTPSGTCEMPPGDCGRDMMMCCDLGGTEPTCTGSLNCQFGDCTTCRGPSLTCLLGGLLPGQECCNGSACRPSPLIPRCCLGQGSECANSIDCCGLMGCSGGTCMCSGDSSFCVTDAECCEGLTCDFFQCRPEGPACEEGGATCDSSSECCSGLSCSPVRTEPTAPPVDQCCSGGSASCDENEDCCGRMLCEMGECECVALAGLCDRDIECCDDNICVTGACHTDDGCTRETQMCDPSDNQCCGGLDCAPATAGGADLCCASLGVRCRSNDECCGGTTCNASEVCECIPLGGACSGLSQCCAGMGTIVGCIDSGGSMTCQVVP